MIAITGAAGFIGSNLISRLNLEGYIDLLLVDDFSNAIKNRNLEKKIYSEQIDRDQFLGRMKAEKPEIDIVFHLGARTDTLGKDTEVFTQLNLEFSKELWKLCAEMDIPLIYASSAATYGQGEQGYKDDHQLIPQLNPENPYGKSKNDFDKWALEQDFQPPSWAGIKFFNVFGPNEYHKDCMASVVYHAYHEILETGKLTLFRSHNPDIADGEQKRDFIYVKDVIDVLYFFLLNEVPSGIYNLGTGRARSFLEMGKAVFHSMGIPENIEFIDMPQDIREGYQYFTQADMNKLYDVGYILPFSSLEQGIDDYISHYLNGGEYR